MEYQQQQQPQYAPQQGAAFGQPSTPQEPQYVQIVPSGYTAVEREPFRFALPDGSRWTLPHLQSGDMPLEMIETVLALTSNVQDEVQEHRTTAAVLTYFRMEHPKLHRAIKKHANQIGVAAGLIRQWAEFSQVDPKASGSPTR